MKIKSRRGILPTRFLASIVDSSDDAILSKNLDGIILSWNRGAEKLYGYTPSEVIGKEVSILVPADQPDEIPSIMSKLRKGQRIHHFETRRKRKDGTLLDVSLTISPVLDKEGRITGASAIARDITQEKRFREFRNFLASIIDTSDDAIVSKNLDGYILSWNRGAEKLYGYSESEIVGKHISTLTPDDNPDEIPAIMERLRRGERIEHYETIRVKKDGTRIAISLTVSPIADETGKIIGASAISRDISARKLAEEEKASLIKQLTDTISQKDVLLQEVYHRVKNNLQVVSSLLELRSRYVKSDPVEAATAFRESIGRIRAMALVHEKLYRTENLHNLDFLSYLRSLVAYIVRSYNVESRIEVNISGDPCQFGLDQAIPLGLIFTELITNSFKYAFGADGKGKIDIQFQEINAHKRIIHYSDDGSGLTEGKTFEGSDTFGFRIIKLLARQMKGDVVQIDLPKGTAFRIEIPILREKLEEHDAIL